MIEITNEVVERIRATFENEKRILNPNIVVPNNDDRYVQISTAFDSSSVVYLHYELYQGKAELHFEKGCDKEDDNIRDLINYLKGKTENYNAEGDKLSVWQEWECGYRYQYKEVDEKNYEIVLKEFVERFDQYEIQFLKQFDPKDDNEMSEQKEPVELYERGLEEILKLPLKIPDYQRIYCWEDKNVEDLWNNLIDILPLGKEYHLGGIILHRKEDENGKVKYNIIDGQQRLVTLTLILSGLEYCPYSPLQMQGFYSEEARTHIANTKEVISYLSKNLHVNKGDFIKEIKELRFSVLVLQGDNLDLAYTFFSNQNSKGVPLSDYDLLKAHHLRYISMPEEANHLARQWNKKIKDEDGFEALCQVLGTHLYRLRKWMRKRDFDENKRLRVKEEFSAAPTIRGIPPFGERFNYYEKIQGGSHFFAYTDHFVYLYNVFVGTNHVKFLREELTYQTNPRYESVIETLLFGYYLKFGVQYFSEALFCIAGVMAQYRYMPGRAMLYKIRESAAKSEMVMMMDQAPSPTFFFAEALPLIRISGKSFNGIRLNFYNSLKRIFNRLDDFTDETIRNKKEYEYGK